MAAPTAPCEYGLSTGDCNRFGWPFPARCFPTIAERTRRQTDYSRGMIRPSDRAPSIMHSSDRNLRFGWWWLLVFLSLGGALEALHGFKIGWYVDVGNDMRRLMFTLAHAHGTALGLVNIAAGLTARNIKGFPPRPSVSLSLIWAGILFPVGFFLGGIVTYGGDPGLGIWLVPIAALLLFYCVARIAFDLSKSN